MLKNRKLHCPEKGATRFVRIFQIILHLISEFLACSIAMDQARRWVIKYFSCLLRNAVSNDDIIVTSQQRFVSGVVVCQLMCRLAVNILNIIFSHALSICRLFDESDAKMCELTLQIILFLGLIVHCH